MGTLKCFHAVIMPDFIISVGKNGMPLVMCLWNKYRNHALAHYIILNDIPVIPNINILPEYCWDWCFDGLPEGSTVACWTNGRVKSKAARLEFCVGFKEMERRLKPLRVIIVGRIPEELETDTEIINFETRNQKINKECVNGNNDWQLPEKEETFQVPNEKDGTFREIIPQKIWNTEERRIK